MSPQGRAALASFGRTLGATSLAAAGTAYLAIGKSLGDLGLEDLDIVATAAAAAGVLTLVNALRSGNRSFGRNAVTPTPSVEPVAVGPVPEDGPVPGTVEAGSVVAPVRRRRPAKRPGRKA